MAADLGPGDWVECIDASISLGLPDNGGLVLGGIYLVRAVVVSPPGFLDAGVLGLVLAGRDAGLNQLGRRCAGYRADRFRPIYRPSADFIEALKAPVTRTPQVHQVFREAI